MGVIELRGDLDFAQEAVGTQGPGQLWLEDLDGDLAFVLQVVRQVDRGHATPAEFRHQTVAVCQSCREPIEIVVGHHGPLPGPDIPGHRVEQLDTDGDRGDSVPAA